MIYVPAAGAADSISGSRRLRASSLAVCITEGCVDD